MSDFQLALKKVQPSAKREGYDGEEAGKGRTTLIFLFFSFFSFFFSFSLVVSQLFLMLLGRILEHWPMLERNSKERF